MELLLVYLITVNAAGLVLMLADKRMVRKKSWRIPEAVLMGTAAAGGSIGVLTGMKLARHKTLHLKFSIGVPVLLALQTAVTVVLLCRYIK